jgi:hypothetical protein
MSRDHSLSEQLCHWALPSAMMSVGVLTFVAVARHSNAEAGAASGVVGIGSMTSAPSSMLAFGLYFGFTLTSLTRLHGRPRRGVRDRPAVRR